MFIYLVYILIFFINFAKSSDFYLKRKYSLIKPYTDDRWGFAGNTIISSNAVRLTADNQGQRGSVWSNYPCSLHSWEVHIHFKVHGENMDYYGDGFAFWYAKTPLETGPVFGSRDKFIGLGVFFDTYANQNGAHNHGHPYVSAMVNNGTLNYDHDRDGTHTELDGCQAFFRNSRFDTFAAIKYHKNKLTVSLDIDGNNNWNECFEAKNVQLPTKFYFGLSAATGDLSDNHDIYSVKVYDLTEPDETKDYDHLEPSADIFAQPRDHVDDPKMSALSRLHGWKLVLLVLIGAAGLFVCLMIGYILYSRNQQTSRKRLY